MNDRTGISRDREMKKNRMWGDRTQESARFGRASAGRATALVAIALVAASALSGCSSLYSEAAVTGAGIAGAGVANSVTSNAAVATGIGLGAVAAARAGVQYSERVIHRNTQDSIAKAAGPL